MKNIKQPNVRIVENEADSWDLNEFHIDMVFDSLNNNLSVFFNAKYPRIIFLPVPTFNLECYEDYINVKENPDFIELEKGSKSFVKAQLEICSILTKLSHDFRFYTIKNDHYFKTDSAEDAELMQTECLERGFNVSVRTPGYLKIQKSPDPDKNFLVRTEMQQGTGKLKNFDGHTRNLDSGFSIN